MHSIYEVIAFLLQTQLVQKFKKLSELATLIDIRNPFFTRKIKKLNKKLSYKKKTCILRLFLVAVGIRTRDMAVYHGRILYTINR